MSRAARAAALAASLAATLALAACGGGNPLLGRWTLQAPMAQGITLGTYEFRRSSATLLGVEQPVEYSVAEDGSSVLVVPQGIGLGFEVEIVDENTARLPDPLGGGMLTLRRLR